MSHSRYLFSGKGNYLYSLGSNLTTRTDERIILVVDDGLDAKEIVQHRFGGAVGAFHPSLIVGIGFAHDENIGVSSVNQLRRLANLLLHIADIIMRRIGVIAGVEGR